MSEKKQFSRHLLKSVLIAFCLTAVYLMIAPALIKGMYAELFHFFVAIGLFCISIVFYFVYTFFKSIHKLRWLFGGLALFAAVIAVANANLDIMLLNGINNSKLPEKYLAYQDLNQPLLAFKNKEMLLLIDGNTDLQHYLTKKNQLIVVQDTYEPRAAESVKYKEYSKFDSLGNFITKYKTAITDEILFEGYLINRDKNYYRTWPLDGDTTKIKFEVYNIDFSFSENKQADFLAKIEQSATMFFSKECWITDSPSKLFLKTIFMENDKWMAFYSDRTIQRTIQSRGKVYNDLFRYYSREDYKLVPYYNKNIQYQYFQKISLNRSNSGSENWDGILFANIIVNKDTLKIKETMTLGREWEARHSKYWGKNQEGYAANREGTFSPYFFYSNPKIPYQLFSNHLGRLYIIKSK
ncbi:hypothetical protein [Flavobacterium sp. NKUCC04_CG]|uniref:hypothetical protein n=1 Tax=Flavobacterium sp. NKUCC04_CG TaxID=2842121 RepID=UPI001C5AA474|nr:hypothetical protein [Flavobacterium sp. NKUCC04_CG]MBW3517905.1 hypothetical protein [Flavobacterium sp. NKUCC04_CG]